MCKLALHSWAKRKFAAAAVDICCRKLAKLLVEAAEQFLIQSNIGPVVHLAAFPTASHASLCCLPVWLIVVTAAPRSFMLRL
jgi:hypothetical protein